jgi:hypothetical protein
MVNMIMLTVGQYECLKWNKGVMLRAVYPGREKWVEQGNKAKSKIKQQNCM